MAGYDATYPAVYPADEAPPVGSDPSGAFGQDKTVTIRVQTLDGVWETVGVDRLRGVWPENDSYTADDWGPSKCSFDLRRDPGAIFPDLGAWTPCEVEIGGVLVWDGRVRETPVREAERVVNVQGFGWQYHLDDDQYQRVYVHARLADYKDTRALPTAPLNYYIAGGQINADRGMIQIAIPNGTALAGSDNRVGVTLDLGQGNTAKRIVVEWETSTSTLEFYARASDTQDSSAASFSDAFSFALAAGSGTTAGTFATARRYVHLFLYYSGAATTPTRDIYIRLKSVKVFTETAFESGNQSVLKATDIIPDALNRTTILLSGDRSGIDPDATVTFAFPEFALSAQRTPREVIDAANSVHGYLTQVAVGRRMIFKPKPSVPLIEIGAWPGSEFDDASANSGEDIYNRVIIEGTGADGAQLSVERSAGQQTGTPTEIISNPAVANPSFAIDTTGWTPSTAGTITRDTALFGSSPASGRWERGINSLIPGDSIAATCTGTFLRGVTYVLQVALGSAGAYAGPGLEVRLGEDADRSASAMSPNTGFPVGMIAWTPTANRSAVQLVLVVLPGNSPKIVYIDSLVLAVALPTLVDRRGFRRTHTLPVECSLTPALGKQIGDVFLDAHRTTPLKGSVKIAGNQGCRHIQTGYGFPPERLLLMTGELLRLSHRIDPDTGGQGRDGRIAEVTYTPATDAAVVALDSRRTSHEALLKRLAVVVGS